MADFFGFGGKSSSRKIPNEDLRVLLVEDESFMMSMLKRMLSKIRIDNVLEATDGGDALQKLEMHSIDLIVADIMMEPVNGLHLLKAIRSGQSAADSRIPFFVLTGSEEMSVFGTALAFDCDAFTSKNTEPMDLLYMIDNRCGGDRGINAPEFYESIAIPDITISKTQSLSSSDEPEPRGDEGVDLDQVEPGSVLIKDLRMPDGTVLYPAGFILAQPHLDCLSDITKFAELPKLVVE